MKIDISAYTQRIGYNGGFKPDPETLRGLHRAHMLAVPFENLDIALGRPIILDEGLLFDKIVRRKRGGFCFELNTLFAGLLKTLGFQVQHLSARMYNEEEFGMDFGHMTLMVQLEECWLVDVGGGDSFLEPLRLDSREPQMQDGRSYKIEGDDRIKTCFRLENGGWKPQYKFRLRPYTVADFIGACSWTQSSPESRFTQKRICSLPTETGRITLKDGILIVSYNGSRQERQLENEEEVQELLRRHFGIVL